MLTANAVSQVPQLLGAVQNLYALGVRVVSDGERSGNGAGKLPVRTKTTTVLTTAIINQRVPM